MEEEKSWHIQNKRAGEKARKGNPVLQKAALKNSKDNPQEQPKTV